MLGVELESWLFRGRSHCSGPSDDTKMEAADFIAWWNAAVKISGDDPITGLHQFESHDGRRLFT